MKSSQHGLDGLGYTRAALAKTTGSNNVNQSKTLKLCLFGRFRLFSETREHEVGIASNRISEKCGEYFSFLVHTARHIMGVLNNQCDITIFVINIINIVTLLNYLI